MEKIYKIITLAMISVSAISLLSCGSDLNQVQKKPVTKNNFIVLLDLSDRILNDGQIERDKELIVSVYQSFLDCLQSNFYVRATDEFKVVMAYQKDAVPSSRMYEIEDQLYINVENVPLQLRKSLRDSIGNLRNKLDDLYELAKISEKHNDYSGADIQGYLGDRLAADLPKDQETINHLIILTDGYQYVEGRSEPIAGWPAIADLSNVNVIVLEMSPNLDKAGEQSAMISAWTEWLEKMNAKKKELVVQSALVKEKQVLFDFLNTGFAQPQSIAQKEEIVLPTRSVRQGSARVPDGDYISLQGGKFRSLQIRKVKDEGDVEVFVCSILQLGSEYHNLHGEIDPETGLLKINKLGVFGVEDGEKSFKLISNTQNLEYSLKK